VADEGDRKLDRAAVEPTSRRQLLRIGAATAIGGLVLTRVGIEIAASRTAARVSILSACEGCTGCVAVCPEGAIAVAAPGIAVEQAKCTRCGFCLAVCPVGGVLVHREDGRG
jgi:ferredoxin